MKRSWVVLVLGLFIVTSLYAVPSTVAVTYSASDQSITSFSETLSDDVLYYPDAWMNTTEGTATSGDDDYADSKILDSDYWETDGDEIANFQYFDNFDDNVTVEAFTYHCYGHEEEDSSGVAVLEYYNTQEDDWVTLETFTTSDAWYNDTVYISGLYEPNIVGLQINTYYFDTEIEIDYLSVNITYLTVDNSERTATSGDDDYADSIILDGVYWETEIFEEATFDNNVGSNMQGFIYHCYGKESHDFSTILEYYDGDDWVTLETFTTSLAWYNDTVSIYLSEVRLRINTEAQDGWTQVDYLSVTIIYSQYAESFADVSDWTFTGDNMTSDGDKVTHGYDGTWKRLNTDAVSFSSTEGLYVEYRLKSSVALGTGSARLFGYAEDASQGGYSFYDAVSWSDEWTTHRYLISSLAVYNEGPLESLRFSGNIDDGNTVEIDYLRIAPATKMGLGYDASTIEGISSSDGGTIESDGDLATLTADGDGSTFIIVADTTTTATAISTAYYPFFGIEIDSGFNFWGLEQYDGSAYATLQTSTLILEGTYRFNMASLDTYVESWRINLTANAFLVWDWAKAYSIANFTVTESGAGIDTVLYVDSGTLVYSSTTDPSSIRILHDPLLSVDAATFIYWNISSNTGVNTTASTDLNFYDSFGNSHIDETFGDWHGETGTLTDIELRFYTATTIDISAISFLTIDPYWHEIDEIELWFDVAGWNIIDTILLGFGTEIFTASFEMLLIFLGLFMIPASTIFFVKGGKSEMSTDKLLLVILCFFMGWALFLGGIMS